MDTALPSSIAPTGIDPSGLMDDPRYMALKSSSDQARSAYENKMAEATSKDPGNAPTIQDAMSGRQEIDKADPFTGLPPVDHLNDLMSQAPWLIGLAALGGKTFGVPAQAMLSATNGMVSGLIKGDQQAYQSEKDKYDAEYERYQKKHNEIFTIYKELHQAYKSQYGEYQAQLKAAQSLKGIVGERDADMKNFLESIKLSNKIVTDKTRAAAAKENADKKQSGAGDGADGGIDPTLVGAIKEGAMPNEIVKGYGKVAGNKYDINRRQAAKELAKELGITEEQAGAELVRRQIDKKAGQSGITVLTKQLDTVRPAVAQLDFNVDQATQILKTLPSTDLSPLLNAIARKEEKWTGDPQYSSLYFYMHAAAVESARIQSGGTGSVAQLNEGAANRAQEWANSNMTPSSFIQGVGPAMKAEGRNRIETLEQAIEKQRGKRDEDKPGNKYASPDDVKSAFKAGKITREQAMSILKKDFQMGD